MNSTKNKIKGKARAMVITRSRLHAVLYKRAFDKYIKEQGYPIKTLLAFTGTVHHDEQEYSENSMNDLPEKKTIENTFQEDPYRIDEFVEAYRKGEKQHVLHNILYPSVQDYNKLTMKDKVGFKKVLQKYQSIYSFLSQL